MSALITKAEKFLKEIDAQKIDLNNLKKDLKDLDSFLKVYELLNNNLEELLSFKIDMDKKGYSAPYRSLNIASKNSRRRGNDTPEKEQLASEGIYNSRLKDIASEKKIIIDRVKYAITAHRIALGNLEEYAKVKCKDCSKTYRISSFLERDKKCKCGSSDFDFKINHSGIYRLEIIPYLPLSGNYMEIKYSLSDWGRESLKKVLNILNEKRKNVVKTVTPIIRIRENNRTITKRVPLDNEYADSYEDEIRKRYGSRARIERLEFYTTNPPIINDNYTRINLALAYVKHAEEIVERHEEDLYAEKIRDLSNLELYDEIIRSVNLEKPDYIDEDDLDEYRESKIQENLEELGLMDKYGHLDMKLKRDLSRREHVKKHVFAEIAPTLILWDLSKYYLCTSSDRRKRYGSPFPYIMNELDRKQRKVFENIRVNVVNFLRKDEGKHILPVENMDLLLYKKFKLEKKVKNTNIKLNYKALGAAIIYSESHFNLKTVCHAFKVSENSVNNETNNIKSIKKPNTRRAQAFLGGIK